MSSNNNSVSPLAIILPVIGVIIVALLIASCKKKRLEDRVVREPKPPVLPQYSRQRYASANIRDTPNITTYPPGANDIPAAYPAPSPHQQSTFPVPTTDLLHSSIQASSPLPLSRHVSPAITQPIPTTLHERMKEVQRLMLEIHRLEGRTGGTAEEERINRAKIAEHHRRITVLSEVDSQPSVEAGATSSSAPEIREPPPAYAPPAR
ncbi:hypothetical protein NLJ89_g5801 [Agrocybe chaxingu]|uniref:Uncharacterized protein n=1 Tax=Agrocybe chaxingu TaxID=84603 RepID=A0A9W8JZW6_9AGAR|nr:hypothetical protein NLJ89_g5801 [Agrocybe chaxingu]